MTIKDIAERAGVSFSTVSKALQGSPLVRKSTRDHVLAIAREMGYEPNLAARSLVSKRTGAIGIVWPSIRRAALSSLITSLNGELEKEGYTALLSMSGAESAIKTFRRFQVDAILVFGDESLSELRIGESAPRRPPVLVYGAAGSAPCSTVDVNRGRAIKLAVEHLAGLGHRNIVHIGQTAWPDPMQAEKIEAFREEMNRLGLPLGDRSVVPIGGLEFHDGYEAAWGILRREDRPTAAIAGGIDLSRGILRAARDLGLSVPRDLSVVSFDNLPEMEDLEIPMTAVGVAVADMAAVIAGTLLELTANPEAVQTVYLEPVLVVRSSTAANPRSGTFRSS